MVDKKIGITQEEAREKARRLKDDIEQSIAYDMYLFESPEKPMSFIEWQVYKITRNAMLTAIANFEKISKRGR